MPRWFKITLWVLGGAALCCAVLFAYILYELRDMDWDFSNADDGHIAASADFYAALGTPDCLTRDAIIAEARARGWDTRDEDGLIWSHSPDGLQDWLRVTIEPSLFMSTDDENPAFFGFDADGCSVAWSYG